MFFPIIINNIYFNSSQPFTSPRPYHVWNQKGDPDPNEYFTTPGGLRFFVALENLKRRRAKYSKDSYLYVALLWDQLMERDSYLLFFDLSPGGVGKFQGFPEFPPDKSVKGSNMYGYIYTEGFS